MYNGYLVNKEALRVSLHVRMVQLPTCMMRDLEARKLGAYVYFTYDKDTATVYMHFGNEQTARNLYPIPGVRDGRYRRSKINTVTVSNVVNNHRPDYFRTSIFCSFATTWCEDKQAYAIDMEHMLLPHNIEDVQCCNMEEGQRRIELLRLFMATLRYRYERGTITAEEHDELVKHTVELIKRYDAVHSDIAVGLRAKHKKGR